MNNFQTLEAVHRGSETPSQMAGKLNILTLVLLDPDIYVFKKVSTQIKCH